MRIPFNNLEAQHQEIQKEIDVAIHSAIHSFQFVRGNAVHEFENAFAKKLGVPHCINTGNGTDALFISLKALNIGSGDEVLTPAFSWISSAETINLCGATPVFIDVNEQTYTIDPTLLEQRINKKTKAVLAVHLYGQAAHLAEIKKLCIKHGIYLIEDCAQAHLTKEGEQYAGTVGDLATFSFYPTKNLGAYGDAGCITTHNHTLAEKIRRLSNHGALQKDDHLLAGLNSRMDTLQAAILLAKLPHLDRWNNKRRANAEHYRSRLQDIPELQLPQARANTQHTYHLFVIRTTKRDELKQFLEERGIQTIIHYPKALTNLELYSNPETVNLFPVANQLEKEVLSLPVFPELSSDHITFICETIREFYLK